MEYVFGRRSSGVENLLVKDMKHGDLIGMTEIKREYGDCFITDAFSADTKYKSSEDSEGNCYDWYEISDHTRTIDFTKRLEPRVSDTEDAITGILELLPELGGASNV
ncbi:MAG: hypothetical protein VB031_02100 [Eubacteriaceae bacterium]|nr:hypothetical protein [Eubacteriaceae bacterium]